MGKCMQVEIMVGFVRTGQDTCESESDQCPPVLFMTQGVDRVGQGRLQRVIAGGEQGDNQC